MENDHYNQEHKSQTPLDNDALTKLVYIHDDDITRLFAKIHAMEQRIQELESKGEVLL